MWTIIEKNKYEEYLDYHFKLKRYAEQIILYENKQFYFLPRHFSRKYPHKHLISHHDKNFKAQPLNIKFQGQYRDHQKIIIPNLLNKLQQFKSGILKSRPGSGKTVMSIAIACALNLKTLIIIDQENIYKQWVDDTICNSKFTNCSEVGIIQGNKFKTDYPFTIAMVQTLSSRVSRLEPASFNKFYLKMREAGFGLAVIDECHTVSAGEKYAKASIFLNTPHILGLSATPFTDELQSMYMNDTIGEILYEYKDYDLTPIVNFLEYNSNMSTYIDDQGNKKNYSRMVKYGKDLMQQRSKYNSILPKNEKYHNIILQLNKELYKDNHTIVNVVQTEKLVQQINHKLNQNNLDSKPLYAKDRDLEKTTQRIVVSTYKYISKAFDWENLSALIIGLPLSGKKSWIQLCGRILRSSENKKQPVVYYLIDRDFQYLFGTKNLISNIIRKEFDINIQINEIEF